MDPNNVKTNKTGKSAIGFLLMGIAVIAVIVAVCLVFYYHPEYLQNLLWAVLIIIGAIVLIAAIIAVVMFLMAIPVYALKGEKYQSDMEYSIDDAKSVKETSSDDPVKKE